MKHSAIPSNILVLSVAMLSSGKYCLSFWLIVFFFSLTSKSIHPWENNNIDFNSMAYFPLSQLETNRGGGVDRVLTREIFDLTNK